MLLTSESTVLRATIAEDEADYRRWIYEETEWMEWDAPWEQWEDGEKERFVKSVALRAEQTPTTFYRLEIATADGRHIGWVSAYIIDGTNMLAVGIDIPEQSARRKGHARRAMQMFIGYLFEATGKSEIYTQTWSGNTRMIGLAEKLGFEEVNRAKGCRMVNGQLYDALTFVLKNLTGRNLAFDSTG